MPSKLSWTSTHKATHSQLYSSLASDMADFRLLAANALSLRCALLSIHSPQYYLLCVPRSCSPTRSAAASTLPTSCISPFGCLLRFGPVPGPAQEDVTRRRILLQRRWRLRAVRMDVPADAYTSPCWTHTNTFSEDFLNPMCAVLNPHAFLHRHRPYAVPHALVSVLRFTRDGDVIWRALRRRDKGIPRIQRNRVRGLSACNVYTSSSRTLDGADAPDATRSNLRREPQDYTRHSVAGD
ncbi:hypothetical protein FB451DRAFT_1388236 [Mycena latifolia]|nr:hypothetical protein FB451DRAFT_1388236 [Mycena latifolia]